MRAYFSAVAVALAFSMMPLPPVTAAPLPPASPVGASQASPVENVRHRSWHRPRHCHRSVQRHSVRGYGRVWHRHVGPRCRVQLVRRDHRRDDCIRIGDVRICF